MKLSELEKVVFDHMAQDKAFHDKMDRVLFGSKEEKEVGIVEMIKTMYDVFTTTKNLKGWILGLAIIGGAIATIKGWWISIFTIFTK